eukprot:6979347-Prymnesium_polylepis.1
MRQLAAPVPFVPIGEGVLDEVGMHAASIMTGAEAIRREVPGTLVASAFPERREAIKAQYFPPNMLQRPKPIDLSAKPLTGQQLAQKRMEGARHATANRTATSLGDEIESD